MIQLFIIQWEVSLRIGMLRDSMGNSGDRPFIFSRVSKSLNELGLMFWPYTVSTLSFSDTETSGVKIGYVVRERVLYSDNSKIGGSTKMYEYKRMTR